MAGEAGTALSQWQGRQWINAPAPYLLSRTLSEWRQGLSGHICNE
jgi:hypothetical protein